MKYNIKFVRQSLNMTQEQLAEKSNVSRQTISALESGECKVTTTDTLVKLSQALGVTVSDIFFEDVV